MSIFKWGVAARPATDTRRPRSRAVSKRTARCVRQSQKAESESVDNAEHIQEKTEDGNKHNAVTSDLSRELCATVTHV